MHVFYGFALIRAYCKPVRVLSLREYKMCITGVSHSRTGIGQIRTGIFYSRRLYHTRITTFPMRCIHARPVPKLSNRSYEQVSVYIRIQTGVQTSMLFCIGQNGRNYVISLLFSPSVLKLRRC